MVVLSNVFAAFARYLIVVELNPVLCVAQGYQKHAGSYEEMEEKRCEDGFQEARGQKGGRKGETRSRQTSEGKQKLMKQDVATDGSLHTSKHGTLAGPLQTPHPFLPLLLLMEKPKTGLYRCCSHGTVNHHSGS